MVIICIPCILTECNEPEPSVPGQPDEEQQPEEERPEEQACLHKDKGTYQCVCACVCVCVCAHACVCVCAPACVCVCVCTTNCGMGMDFITMKYQVMGGPLLVVKFNFCL